MRLIPRHWQNWSMPSVITPSLNIGVMGQLHLRMGKGFGLVVRLRVLVTSTPSTGLSQGGCSILISPTNMHPSVQRWSMLGFVIRLMFSTVFCTTSQTYGFTVYLEQITHDLSDGQPLDDTLFQYLSPLSWEHINLTGDYVWRRNNKIVAGSKFKPVPNP